ncbi:class I SAM-dependent methyltransferase [Saccharopolyspora rosea]|uniref:Class I SAM-dependent methyltransferase n=1 Tax=Saccharopolyspora rosea TaxID=524884 RepID=A0ABW3FPP6_9PSEU
MDSTVSREIFESAYETGTPPWVIGEPQPAVVELERSGGIRGAVLDPGCGTGEHTIHLARLGYDVLGLDITASGVELARANAAGQGVDARFEVADALALDGPPRFDTVVDSALFHVFGRDDQVRYTAALHRACRPGATAHVLALSDVGPAVGPQVSELEIRDAFAAGWRLEEIRTSRYLGCAPEEQAAELGVAPGQRVECAAWLALATRL